MGDNRCTKCKRIRIGVDDTDTLPITLRPGLFILDCFSKNPSIATCSNSKTSVQVTGRSPGLTIVGAIIGNGSEPAARLTYVIKVNEHSDE